MKIFRLIVLSILTMSLWNCGFRASQKVLVPVQENRFTQVYSPSGDYFFGPETKQLKEGQWYKRWIPNDHCFVKHTDGLWHIFGITHPYVDFTKGGIHEGEYASFHAVSSAIVFKKTVAGSHYSDLPKVLPPKERPDEIPANHAPYIIQKDGIYYMVYGHSPIRLATSTDLYNWTPKGNLFQEEKGARDPNLLFFNGTYYMTYCSEKCVRIRTSKDLYTWSKPRTILTTNNFDPESPSLISYNNSFYLFVCAWEGVWDKKELQGAYTHKTLVYVSDNLMDFGTDKEKQITTLNAHAPEIFQDEEGDWWISSVMYPNEGVQVDKLCWE